MCLAIGNWHISSNHNALMWLVTPCFVILLLQINCLGGFKEKILKMERKKRTQIRKPNNPIGMNNNDGGVDRWWWWSMSILYDPRPSQKTNLFVFLFQLSNLPPWSHGIWLLTLMMILMIGLTLVPMAPSPITARRLDYQPIGNNWQVGLSL